MPVSSNQAILNWNFSKTLLLCFAASQIVCGCVMVGETKSKGDNKIGLFVGSKVDSIRLFTSPSLLNFDNQQGVDGFLAKIYAIQNGTPKPVEIRDGRIEFALYEEVVEGEPLQVWRYEEVALKRQMSNSRIGIVYDFQISWDSKNKPRKKAAVLARYIAPDGREIRALPVVLSLEP
tara:strand:+ start:268 stop:798 length:531 start_codon:yes stop_codon:yes gene_type:complete